MKTLELCIRSFFILVVASSVNAGVLVSFDRSEYVVTSIGEPFDVKVLIDADDRTPEIEPIPPGLFSFGAEIQFDSTKAHVVDFGEIDIVDNLDNFGFSAGGFKEANVGVAASKGNIDQSQNPLNAYGGSVLMTATLTNSAAPMDEYPLELNFFRTLGATEQLFVDGTGSAIDSDITFGTALVRVVPEPSTLWSTTLVMLATRFYRRKNR